MLDAGVGEVGKSFVKCVLVEVGEVDVGDLCPGKDTVGEGIN